MAVDFPNSPALNQIFTAPNGSGYSWDGAKWELTAAASSGGVTSVTAGAGLTGGTITSSGTIALAIPVTVPDGGTGSTHFVSPSPSAWGVGHVLVWALASGSDGPLTAQTNGSGEMVGGWSDGCSLVIMGTPGPYIEFGSYRGTPAAPTAVQLNDVLGALDYDGYGATNVGWGMAKFVCQAAENWTDTAQGTLFDWYTTPAGTTSTALALQLDGSGNLTPSGRLTMPQTLTIGSDNYPVQGIHQQCWVSGTVSSNPGAPWFFNVSDTMNVGANNWWACFVITHDFDASSGTGCREPLFVTLQTANGTGNQYYVSAQFNSILTSGYGNVFATNPYVQINAGVNGASTTACGEEVDTDVRVNVLAKSGIQIVDISTSVGTGGTGYDCGLLIEREVGAAGYAVGLQFGRWGGGAVVANSNGVRGTGTILQVVPGTEVSGQPDFTFGIDFRSTTLGSGGAYFISPGFRVDGYGNTSATTLSSGGPTAPSGGYVSGDINAQRIMINGVPIGTGGGGGITSITAGTGLTGGTITTSGTIALASPIAASFLPAYTGDVTSPAGSTVNTLATVNSNIGTFQGITVNAKGLVTAAVAQNYLTQVPAYTGDVTSAVGGTVNTLATVNSSIGTWNNVTINAKGLATAGSNVAYLTANQTITLTGDITGSGTTAINATLANTAVTAGSYTNTNLTVDAKGRITAASNGAAGGGDLSGMTAGQIPIAATATTVTSSANLSGDITSNSTLVTSLATVNSNVGTFQGLTVNAKGLVTAAANQSYAPLASPTFTGTPSLPTGTVGVTQAAATSNTTLATTAFVKAQGYGSGSVTSIVAGTGLTGGTISTTGTIALSAPVSVANGGTNATTAAAALTSLGAFPIAGGTMTGSVTVTGAIQSNGSAAGLFFQEEDATTNLWGWFGSTALARLWLQGSGYPMTLDHSGNITVLGGTATKATAGSWVAPSSIAVKRNIEPYRAGLAEVMRLDPVSFEYNGAQGTLNDGKRYIGLVAEAAGLVMPELVSEVAAPRYEGVDERMRPTVVGEERVLMLDPSALTYVLINAVQELARRLEELKA